MLLSTSLLKVILTLNELRDFAREFSATREEVHLISLLKRCINKRLRHVKVQPRHTLLVCNRGGNSTGAQTGVRSVVS